LKGKGEGEESWQRWNVAMLGRKRTAATRVAASARLEGERKVGGGILHYTPNEYSLMNELHVANFLMILKFCNIDAC